MTVITEGSLTFSFVTGAQATKYDEWRFYARQFQGVCGCCKAVDILHIDSGVLWLIEIKDYRRHPREKSIDFATEVSVKVRDTLAGLFAAAFNGVEQEERNFARLALRQHRIKIVLHLEQPQHHSKLFPRAFDPAKLELKLRQLLKPISPHPRVVDMGTLRLDMPWAVQG